jgi:hydrogenase expression/formation protein HypE
MSEIDLSCPLPASDYPRIVLAHGGGGRVMQRLIHELFVAAFANPQLERGHDGARLDPRGPIAMTTDAFTVSPRRFPGGDLGSLAVHGTVNDLAMCGARPRWLSASFILEEGLELAELRGLVASMAAAARACGVEIVTGDTKVVERGAGDGVFITTTGIGELVGAALTGAGIGPEAIAVGDAILVSGPVGDHGVAVLAARERLELDPPLRSDAGPVHVPVLALLEANLPVHCLRDPTRGGLASVLAELAGTSGLAMHLREAAIPVRDTVADVCELLGLDPLYVACEGRFVAFVAPEAAARAMQICRAHGCADAAVIGEVQEAPARTVVLQSATGSQRVLDLLSGEQLPRIC